MQLKKASKDKFLFQKKIEEGDFSFLKEFDNIKDAFTTYVDTNNYLDYTTFRSFLIYINKLSMSSNNYDPYEVWENIKKKGVDLSLIIKESLDFDYFKHLEKDKSNNFEVIKVNLSNFNTLLNFGFYPKANPIANIIFEEALNNINLANTNPIYVIHFLNKRKDILNSYLDILKNQYQSVNIDYGIHNIDFEDIYNQETLIHFINKSFIKKSEFDDILLAKVFLHFDKEQSVNLVNQHKEYLNNEFLKKNFLNIFNFIIKKDSSYNKDKLKNFIEYIKQQKIELKHLSIKQFENNIEYKNIILELINLKIQYKNNFEEYIYSLNNIDIELLNIPNKKITDFFVVNKLWNILEKDNNGINFLEYHENILKNIKTKREQYRFFLKLKLKLNSLLYKNDIQDIAFLNHLNPVLSSFLLKEFLYNSYIKTKVIENYSENKNIIELIGNFENNEDINYKYFYRENNIHKKHLIFNENQFLKTLDFLETEKKQHNISDISKFLLLTDIIKANHEQTFFYKNIHITYNIFLKYAQNIYIEYLDLNIFKNIDNILYSKNKKIIFENKEINKKYISFFDNKNPFFDNMKKEFYFKKTSYEKTTISNCIEKKITINSKKRI